MTDQPTFRLTFSCPDEPGIVSKVSGFLFENGANILSAHQHRDNGQNQFFMRVVFGFKSEQSILETFRSDLADLGQALNLNWKLTDRRVKSASLSWYQSSIIASVIYFIACVLGSWI